MKLQLPHNLKRQVIHICEDYPRHFIFFNDWDDVENLKKSDTKPEIQESYIIMENTCFGLLLGQRVTCRIVN